jgi:Zn-dependent protease with chaperone function
MITADGKWYDGKRSTQVDAVLRVLESGALIVERADDRTPLYRQNDVRQFSAEVSDRLADTPRLLTFHDGSVFETQNNSAIDQLLQKLNRSDWSRWVHLLESHKGYVLLALICVMLVAAAAVKYGVPATAKLIAFHLPHAMYETADRQVLNLLDRIALKPSELQEQTQTRIRDHFGDTIASVGMPITLLFRHGGGLGPNAFALPGGTIIFTDALIELAEHDDELLAILVHEIGHVVHRHGMRRMVQDSLLTFAFLAVTGDASGVTELFLGLPAILTDLAYSRQFEREADQYALDYLLLHNIPPGRFADILTRIDKKGVAEQEQGREWTGYLSTHPPTPERVQVFLEAATE